jgi:hypothetical protein
MARKPEHRDEQADERDIAAEDGGDHLPGGGNTFEAALNVADVSAHRGLVSPDRREISAKQPKFVFQSGDARFHSRIVGIAAAAGKRRGRARVHRLAM